MDKKDNGNQTPEPQGEVKKFNIGDLAVYPAHGVGKIEAIESRDVNGETHDFYIMKVLENGMVIMIPPGMWPRLACGISSMKKMFPRSMMS
jgi:CarD family transcriptional regulator